MTAPTTLARNANLATLVQVLREGQASRLDVVAPVGAIRAEGANLVLTGTDVQLTEEGVTTTDGIYRPTAICDDGLADKLGIPPGYLTRMRNLHPDLFDQNVNGWLQHPSNADRKFLVRALRSDETGLGVGRAFLSDAYKPIENLDVLMSVLEAVKAAGVRVDIHSADLTDRRMYVKMLSPEVTALAPTLLARYRSPFNGNTGADNPVISAGFTVSNSEVGHGAFMIAPFLMVQVCSNGMQLNAAGIRAQHLGGKLELGPIQWSDETQQKNLELIAAKTRDAITAFLNPEWVQTQVNLIEAKAATKVADVNDTIEHISTKLRYNEAQQNDILAMFIAGGDVTTGGVMQAVTASAQNQGDADVAAAMEGDALRVLELAYAHNL
jgi:dsDNA-binding SOS-regulon protein